MKVSSSLAIAVTVTALGGIASADDFLFSQRLLKRGLTDDGNYQMSFFHVNDVHGRLDQFTKYGTDCTDGTHECYGGYSRIKTKVNELRQQNPDSLFLNAGDEFQGTLFFTLFGGDKIAETLNDLKFDAMTLGNHEWDLGDEELAKFLDKLKFPVVACNVKSSYPGLKENIKDYQIFPAHQLAVIGVVTETTTTTSRVGKGTKFLDPIPQVQKTIDEIRSLHPEIKRIVALSHLGFDIDQKLAAETEGLSLIIGGHTNTLLGDMENAEGKYPTIEKNALGHEVFIVTAYRWGEYLGRIDVTFDPDGRPVAYHGAPEHMDKTVQQEKTLQDKIDGWRSAFGEYALQVGETATLLSGEDCWQRDCLMGQVLTDAMLEYRTENMTEAEVRRPDFAFINSGIIRASLAPGKITKGDLKTCFPFETTLVQATYSGAELRKIIEGCISKVNQFNRKPVTSWFQVSDGVTIKYDTSKPAGSQLTEIRINGQPLNEQRDYRMVTGEYLINGGDNMMPKGRDVHVIGGAEKALISYLEKMSPLNVQLTERVASMKESVIKEDKVEKSGKRKGEGEKGTEAKKTKPQGQEEALAQAQAAKQKAIQSAEKLRDGSSSESVIGKILGGVAAGVGSLGLAAFATGLASGGATAAGGGVAAAAGGGMAAASGSTVNLLTAVESIDATVSEVAAVLAEYNPEMALELMLENAPKVPTTSPSAASAAEKVLKGA
ncbi:hypothetical protein CP532_4144 [Ophiocordyceps camponoti-leonardi (nom. inval.)]|nr:hypothetical protein CP532_4144 [Ophiocordyceps camponoti-leonardi (nom. inval.)]